MKLDYKTPLKEMGLIQRRRLFHVTLGGLALLCLLFAFRSTPPVPSSTSTSSNSSEVQTLAVKFEIPSFVLPSETSKELTKEATRLITSLAANQAFASNIQANSSLIIDSKPIDSKVITSKDEKAVKQTIMTLAEAKKASKATSKDKENKELNVSSESGTHAVSLSKSKTEANFDSESNDAIAKQDYETIKIRTGDSLAKIFKRQGYSQKNLEALMNADPKNSKKWQTLQAKQNLKVFLAPNKQVQALALEVSKGKIIQLGKISPNHLAKKEKERSEKENPLITNDKLNNLAIVDKADNAYQSDKHLNLNKDKALANTAEAAKEIAIKNAEKQMAFGKGTVKDSLYLAGKRAGLDKNVVSQLVEIFGWNVDFALVQPTDSFRVLFEEKRIEGEKVGAGPILAAELTFKGKVHRAVRYTDKNGQTGYFTPDGFGLKETFSRYPLAFSHVSSGFGTRNHPVIHKIRKHTGVDFAAPRGTRVNSTGDGKVTFVGTRGGYGRVVEIQHGNRYSTLYAHLSKFAPKLKVGDPVKKGQEIGNVGRTGLATGNHLHYEFRVDGVHRDPLTITLPKKSPIPDSNKRHFLAHAKEMLKLMDQHENKINMVRNEFPRNE